MTAQPQLFRRRVAPDRSAPDEVMHQLMGQAGQDVLPAQDGPLPEHLKPNAARDGRPTQRANERRTGPRERVDRAEVNALASITELAASSGYLTGRNTGTCPVCGKAGLDVNARRNTAHCYHAGCDFQSVSPIGWLMQVDGYEFLEAVAVIKGAPLPERVTPRPRPSTAPVPRVEVPPAPTQRPFTPLAAAARDALWAQTTPVSEAALTYLLSRGFDGDELMAMGVGVADSTVPSDLLPLNAEGRPSLMWRDRVVIPTWAGDTAINLKARTLAPRPAQDPDGHYRKYLNVYGGSAALIGLEALGGTMPETVVLTEGELDWWTMRVLLPDQPCVAVRGLANLSTEQAALFAGCRVYVLLDADTRGNRMLLGDLKGLDDAQARAQLEAEGLSFGAAVEGRRLVRKLLQAGALPLLAETGTAGDLNDLLATLSREDALDTILTALSTAQPLRRRRRLT